MKRSPLKRKTAIRRTAWVPLEQSPLVRKPFKHKAAKDPIPRGVTAAVMRRSGGWCEAWMTKGCTRTGEQRHHRKLRRHGDHSVVNLLLVCNVCHQAIHANPERSYARGLLVRSTDDPATIEVLTGY